MVTTLGGTLPTLKTPEYGSQEYFQNYADIYSRATQPSRERSTAQLKNLMGGTGMLRGTPTMNQWLQKVEQPYQQGLQNLLGQEMGQYSQFAAQKPFQEAALTGQYGGLPTLAREQFEKPYGDITQYQQELVDATSKQSELDNLQAIIGAFGGVSGLMDILLRMGNYDPGAM